MKKIKEINARLYEIGWILFCPLTSLITWMIYTGDLGRRCLEYGIISGLGVLIAVASHWACDKNILLLIGVSLYLYGIKEFNNIFGNLLRCRPK